MADNADKPKDETKGDRKGGGGGGSKTLLIIIIAGFLMFMILAGAGFYILWQRMPVPENAKPDSSEDAVLDEKAVQLTVGPIFSMEPFVVNLADPAGNRFLRTKMSLELRDEELLSKMDKLSFPVRDKILTILSSKKFQDINTVQGKSELRGEITVAVDGLLGKGALKNVYFSDFVAE